MVLLRRHMATAIVLQVVIAGVSESELPKESTTSSPIDGQLDIKENVSRNPQTYLEQQGDDFVRRRRGPSRSSARRRGENDKETTAPPRRRRGSTDADSSSSHRRRSSSDKSEDSSSSGVVQGTPVTSGTSAGGNSGGYGTSAGGNSGSYGGTYPPRRRNSNKLAIAASVAAVAFTVMRRRRSSWDRKECIQNPDEDMYYKVRERDCPQLPQYPNAAKCCLHTKIPDEAQSKRLQCAQTYEHLKECEKNKNMEINAAEHFYGKLSLVAQFVLGGLWFVF